MKGSISDFGALGTRTSDSAKGGRGEARLNVPYGRIGQREIGLRLDPDLRLQEVIRLIFACFREPALASIRYRNAIVALKNASRRRFRRRQAGGTWEVIKDHHEATSAERLRAQPEGAAWSRKRRSHV